MAKKVTRSFYYYNVALLQEIKDELGNVSLSRMKNQKEMFYKTFEYIKYLQDSEDDEEKSKLIANLSDGDKLYILVDLLEKDKPIKFRLIWCRADAMPFIEENGVLSFITDYLKNDFTLAEITHCVIFPEHGIMGAEFNFSGARATSIRWYLPRVYSKIDHATCVDRLNGDVLKQLAEGESFSLFKLVVKNSSEILAKLAAKKSVFLLSATGMPSEVDTYEVTLKRRKTKTRKGFDSPIAIEEMQEFIQENRDYIKSFEVSQGSITKDNINLLKDKLVTTRDLIPTINIVINSEEAYDIIINYYEDVVKPRKS